LFVDTAGHAPREAVEALLPHADTWLYDYKTADPAAFRQVIGGDLALVRDNLAFLLSTGADVRIRIPLIPGFNTDESAVNAIIADLLTLAVKGVDLLPFHRLGSGKYAAMGLEYAYRNTQPMTPREIAEIQKRYQVHFSTHVE
ncbi:MAG: glycyl-radical enzyme activating protein, partial [Clostridia bacterium]|nr:glycyl-radical enzyme activating protein [Clostridia bacterium]